VGVLGWLRQNVFSTWYNALATVLAAWLAYAVLRPALTWAATEAKWQVIAVNLHLFMLGQYPNEAVWRLWLALYLLGLLVGMSWGAWGSPARAFTIIFGAAALAFALMPFSPGVRLNWVGVLLSLAAGAFVARLRPAAFRPWVMAGLPAMLPLSIVLTAGLPGLPFLSPVEPKLWGGLLLTLMLTITGNVLALPLGVLLALGRRSSLPVIKYFSIAYIELIRGAPLVTILFMAQIMLPLFLPTGVRVDSVVRAIIGLTMFEAAYQAENVRGGLQAIPRGQFEAAYALGLNPVLTMGFIILPQAIRLVIPALINSFISLFKDTTLVAIVGLFDLLLVGRTTLAQPDFLGRFREVYLFLFLV
jgi:general L-amino acid transport system permease protein